MLKLVRCTVCVWFHHPALWAHWIALNESLRMSIATLIQKFQTLPQREKH